MQEDLNTNCCVVGGGPAGMMLGLLLFRNGDRSHCDENTRFFHDFRGDTLHPSTLEIMRQLGTLQLLAPTPKSI